MRRLQLKFWNKQVMRPHFTDTTHPETNNFWQPQTQPPYDPSPGVPQWVQSFKGPWSDTSRTCRCQYQKIWCYTLVTFGFTFLISGSGWNCCCYGSTVFLRSVERSQMFPKQHFVIKSYQRVLSWTYIIKIHKKESFMCIFLMFIIVLTREKR